MLREIKPVKQVRGEPKKRWFSDDDFDLMVWLDRKGEIVGFELCYDKHDDQHAIRWQEPSTYTHHRVDDGEGRVGRMKATPILLEDGAFEFTRIATLFRDQSKDLEAQISSFVYEKLMQYPV